MTLGLYFLLTLPSFTASFIFSPPSILLTTIFTCLDHQGISHSFALLSLPPLFRHLFSLYSNLKPIYIYPQIYHHRSTNTQRAIISSQAAMAVYVSMPFLVAAATGIYFLDKNHYQPKELGAGIRATIQDVVAKAKAKVNTTQMPKLAPQFDGLDSFETLVGR